MSLVLKSFNDSVLIAFLFSTNARVLMIENQRTVCAGKRLKTCKTILVFTLVCFLSACSGGNSGGGDSLNSFGRVFELSSDKLQLEFSVGERVNAMASNGDLLYYATRDNGSVFEYNTLTESLSLLFVIGNQNVNSMAYENGNFYFGLTADDRIIKTDSTNTSPSVIVQNINFPDGMGHYDGHIYVVQENDDGNFLVVDTNGNTIRTLVTTVPDTVSIAAHNDSLYVLSESNDIYEVSPVTGTTNLLFDNPISESTDGSLGFEGMAIVNGTVWLSRIDDNSVYTVTDILE
jgi:hypothetical protein